MMSAREAKMKACLDRADGTFNDIKEKEKKEHDRIEKQFQDLLAEGERQEKQRVERLMEEKRKMKDSLDAEMDLKRRQKEENKRQD